MTLTTRIFFGIASLSLSCVATAPLTPANAAGVGIDVPIASLELPLDGSEVSTSRPLQSGVTYRIKVSGTGTVDTGGSVGDAEYAVLSNGAIQDFCGDDPSLPDLGVSMREAGRNASPVNPDWGDFNNRHVYQIEVLGSGRSLSFMYEDCGYDDNAGSLLVEIYRVR